MKSFFVFYILAAAVFVLVQCQEFDHQESEAPHNSTVLGSCANHMKEIFRNRANVVIKPRERHVVLKPEPGYEFNPRTVSVNRCNGQCPGLWSPMPTSTRMKEFILHRLRVRQTAGDLSHPECVSVQVMEHVTCRCGCMKGPQDCTQLQNWDAANCACLCKDQRTRKRECESQRGMVWHDIDCSCKCTQDITECAAGLGWDKERCACLTI